MNTLRLAAFALLCLVPAMAQGQGILPVAPPSARHGLNDLINAPSLTAGKPTLPPTTVGRFDFDPALVQVYFSHLQPTSGPNKALFYGTWFLGGDTRIAMECHVDTKGSEQTGRYVYNWAFQGGDGRQLDAGRMKALRSALHRLPPSSARVPPSRLLLLSYQDGTAWVTREYDRKHLPGQVQKLYDLLGAAV